jgi:hypothetical protein
MTPVDALYDRNDISAAIAKSCGTLSAEPVTLSFSTVEKTALIAAMSYVGFRFSAICPYNTTMVFFKSPR